MEVTIKTKETIEKEVTIQLPYYFQIGELNIFCKQTSEKSIVKIGISHIGEGAEITYDADNTYWITHKEVVEITEELFNSKFNEAMEIIKGAVL